MSKTEMDRLAADFASDAGLRSKFEGLGDFNEAVTVARGEGYDVEAEEAQQYLASLGTDSQAELSDAQLDAVAGGKGRAGNKFAALIGANQKAGDDPSFAINNLIGFYKDL